MTATKTAIALPRRDRTPRTLGRFACLACGHVGVGRLDALTGLTCSRCGAIGARAAREAAPRCRGMTERDLVLVVVLATTCTIALIELAVGAEVMLAWLL